MPLRNYLAALLAVFTASCTTQGVEVRTEPLILGNGGFAAVHIERTWAETADVGPLAGAFEPSPVATGVDAVFAQYHGVDPDEVLELLGWPSRSDGLAGCRLGATESAEALPFDAVVDLLDVGPIHVDLAGEAIVVEGRLFPSVHSLLAGTIYADELSAPPARREAAEYRLFAEGLGGIGQLEALLPAPGPPSGLAIDGQPLEPGVRLSRDESLTLHWDAGDPQDRIELDIRAGGRLLRCTSSDQGSFIVRPEALAVMPADAAAQIAVARVRREPLDIAGIDEAWARLVARRAMTIALD